MTFRVSKGPLPLAAFHEMQKLCFAQERQRMFHGIDTILGGTICFLLYRYETSWRNT